MGKQVEWTASYSFPGKVKNCMDAWTDKVLMTDLALIIENFKFEFPFIQILMGSSQVFVCDNSLVKKSNSSYQFAVVHPERARQNHPKRCRAEDPIIVEPFNCLVTGINVLRWIVRETVKGSREVAMH